MANATGWSIGDEYHLAQTVGRHLRNKARYTTEEFIQAGEQAATEHPGEWIVFYTLADKYQDVGRYKDALEACERCLALRPQDIRSAYALASAFYMLTCGQSADAAAGTSDDFEASFQSEGLSFDPDACRRALAELNLTAGAAAAEAIRWFNHALSLRPDRESRADIEASLEALYELFPALRLGPPADQGDA